MLTLSFAAGVFAAFAARFTCALRVIGEIPRAATLLSAGTLGSTFLSVVRLMGTLMRLLSAFAPSLTRTFGIVGKVSRAATLLSAGPLGSTFLGVVRFTGTLMRLLSAFAPSLTRTFGIVGKVLRPAPLVTAFIRHDVAPQWVLDFGTVSTASCILEHWWGR